MKVRRFDVLSTMFVLVGLLVVPEAFAQRAPVAHPATVPSCPSVSIAANPLSLVDGQTWVFHWEGIADLVAAVGNLTFEMVPSPNSQSGFTGFMNVNEARNVAGAIFRFLIYNGRYEIFPNCTGGTLMFNSGAPESLEFDFFFEGIAGVDFQELVMVSIDPGTLRVLHGSAKKQ